MTGKKLQKELMQLNEKIKKIEPWLVEVRRDFHQYPELGMEEYRTRDKIEEYLSEMGIHDIKRMANTGLAAVIEGKGQRDEQEDLQGRSPTTVALRADMDALPIQEVEGREYGSKNKGKMHACGHDAHMTIVLGAAKLLKEMEREFAGNVKLIFQPAEESFGGAKPMIEEGVLENPHVNYVLGLHVAPELEVGEVGIKYGQMNASSDTLTLSLKGKSCHGAYPHEGVDAILLAGQMITGIQSIVSRNLDPQESAVISFGKIQGGSQGNILADEVTLTGTLRTLNPETRSSIKEKIKTMAEVLPKSFGGTGELTIEEGYSPLINHDDTTKILEENAIGILGKEKVKLLHKASLGVEDFGYFLEERPGTFFRLGTGNKEKGIIEPGHGKGFDIDERSLGTGVKLQVVNTLSLLIK